MTAKRKVIYEKPFCDVCGENHWRSMIYDNLFHWGLTEGPEPEDLLELIEGNEIHDE